MNEYLRPAIGLERRSPIDSTRELADLTVQYFDACVDFLRIKERFPNKDINKLITLFWRLVANKHVPASLDLKRRMPALSFMVLESYPLESALVFLPFNFIDLVDNNPAMQLGAVVYNASQARDWWAGRLKIEKQKGLDSFRLRAGAFEAEMLITLQSMACQDKCALELNSYQKNIVGSFPQGLASLDKSLRYSTPKYTPLRTG